MPRNSERPDIEIAAAVRAKKLRFEEVPRTEVRFADGSRPESRRRNLPDEVEPGVTYRDVEVTWHAQTHVVALPADEVRKTQRRRQR